MAEEVKEVKEVVKKEEKKNRLAEVFSKDYKYEGLILLILAVIAIILGVLIITDVKAGSGIFNIKGQAFLIGDFPILFAVILIVLGAFSFALSVWPYYKPSIYEIKRVTWPTKKTMISNSIDVVIYSASIAVFFYLCDLLLSWVITLL